MRIDGSWRLCDDGVIRPIFLGEVQAGGGSWVQATFLADPGADRTVFSADILRELGLPTEATDDQLEGVGGKVATVLVATPIRLTSAAGVTVLFKGIFAAVTDPAALDMSVLGRDISNLFALVVDRPQDVVCLLGQGHRYVIVQ